MFTKACHSLFVCDGGYTTMFTTACHCVCVVGGTLRCSQQPVTLCVCVCGGGHTTIFTTACHCLCVVEGILPCSQQPVTVCVCGGGHTTMFTTACHCLCVVGGRIACSQQPVTVCVCVVGGTLSCSQQPVTVCVWWGAHYHVHNSLSLSVCGGGHTTTFTTACHSMCVCVCGGGHTTMFATACHSMCVRGGGHTTMFTTACHCVCLVRGTLPCSQQPATHRYLVPGESSLHPAFIFKTLSTNSCQSLLPSLETSREELYWSWGWGKHRNGTLILIWKPKSVTQIKCKVLILLSFWKIAMVHSFRETSHSKTRFYKVFFYFTSSISKHCCYTKLYSVKKAFFLAK